jgi:uncharacterized protein YjbI with pentapeptide repeats
MTDLITDDAEFYLKHFEGLDLAEQTLASRTFESCTFLRCSFSDTVLERCKFIECSFRSCDLSNAKVTLSKWQETSFDECKLLGIDWTRADWPRFTAPGKLIFRKSNVSYASFFGLDLQEITLEECKAHSVDLREGNFSKSNFSYTDFTESLFGKTRLAGVDFTEATNYLIDIQANQVKGAKFSRAEAFGLLYGLDVELV